MLIIGDIHGCYLTFKALYKSVTEQFPGEPVVLTGDLIDRGPRSSQVVQFVMDNKIPCVQGNHEQFMIEDHEVWGPNGGWATWNSYNMCHDSSVFRTHAEWMKTLPPYLEFDLNHANGRRLLVTHAYLGQGDIDKQAQKKQLAWNRDPPPRTTKWFNVCGHTVTKSPIITDWYANIDTGAVYKPAYGKLTCLRFPQMEVFQQDCLD